MENHDHYTQSTPWNFNLSYAIDWTIVLGVPVVLLTVRHLVLVATRAIADRKQRGYHRVVAVDRGTEDSSNGKEEDGDGEHSQDSRKQGVDIPASSRPPPLLTLSSQWSYSRIENWAINKASITLYLGPYVHLVVGATVLVLILLAILVVLLLTEADLMLNSNRAGYLGLSCIPFLFAFTGKNSVISLMTGLSHHRLNQVHRFLGLSLFTLISVHMGCMFHVWWPWKFLLEEQLATTKVRYGLATYTTLCLIVLTAAWPVRRWAYETFVVSHSLFVVFLVLVGLHTPYAMRFTAAGIVVYVLNVLTGWCVKTHVATAQAVVFQDRLTRLQMDKSIAHAPGQHIYVCVPSISLIQWHPFTISSVDANGVTIHARAVGGFTKRLCRWPEHLPKRVLLAGPYGESVSVGRDMDAHKVIFVAAGSGFAYVVPILMDLLQTRRLQRIGHAPVEIVWCVRDPGEVQWFQEEIELALDAAQGYLKDREDGDLTLPDGQETQVRLRIHYTRLSSGDPESVMVPAPAPCTQQAQSSTASEATSSDSVMKAKSGLSTSSAPFAGDERVEWVSSRLDLPAYITKEIQETPRDRVVEIVGCGPSIMLAELHNAVAFNEALSGCRVNLHTERFYV
ncbi:hypothetical protein B0O80DRAFT_494361 [Mortierella sp. GBAus27b]|nr:hypothetical protein B0O80DRAFT_494361 [Mortierella sp. GBAus27b]